MVIQNAVVSVYDKSGLDLLLPALGEYDVTIIASGGTAKTISEMGYSSNLLLEVSEYTGFPELLGGRVKTIHPKIAAGILARRSNPKDMEELQHHGILPIDLVVCNLYPFEETISKENITVDEAVEQIDIGGVTLLRAAAKNYKDVAVVSSTAIYENLIDEMEHNSGSVSLETRGNLSMESNVVTATYEALIANWFSLRKTGSNLPTHLFLPMETYLKPKYGENPGQAAMVYKIRGFRGGLPEWKQLAGDVPSFNNLSDAALAFRLLDGFEDIPPAASVKHGIVSGFAFAPTVDKAVQLAHECDPETDYGGVYVLNGTCTFDVAQNIGQGKGQPSHQYAEILIAPDFNPDALQLLKEKQAKKIRIFQYTGHTTFPFDLRLRDGAVLAQRPADYSMKLKRNEITLDIECQPQKDGPKVMMGTEAKPDEDTIKKLIVAHEIVRRVPSNGIVVGDGVVENGKVVQFQTYGIGTSTKRSRASKMAVENAGQRAIGSLAASDGFFPFPDSIEIFGKAGIKYIIQPGGSIRDHLSISEANKYGIGMVFSHARIFSH